MKTILILTVIFLFMSVLIHAEEYSVIRQASSPDILAIGNEAISEICKRISDLMGNNYFTLIDIRLEEQGSMGIRLIFKTATNRNFFKRPCIATGKAYPAVLGFQHAFRIAIEAIKWALIIQISPAFFGKLFPADDVIAKRAFILGILTRYQGDCIL